ncbi:MAG: hypothetical protein HWQ38_19055 [Nostoc sp. NMS7]|uniref:hypothetical protein n=1 Tax=Nostoc sp. NMS7 TaxID=2815391 RepID=UPI0025FEE501|nr:hypothetical protein [Nostoc sp. NMS7]MBN3948435.1 hypothetical protein [Nostoc sp. NMS7]
MNQRYVNKRRTREKFLDDPVGAIWEFTHEDFVKAGWTLSDEPLRLSNEPCPICEGGKAFQTLGNKVTLHRKCDACDGTGKKLL